MLYLLGVFFLFCLLVYVSWRIYDHRMSRRNRAAFSLLEKRYQDFVDQYSDACGFKQPGVLRPKIESWRRKRGISVSQEKNQ